MHLPRPRPSAAAVLALLVVLLGPDALWGAPVEPVVDSSYVLPLTGTWVFTGGLRMRHVGSEAGFEIHDLLVDGAVFERTWLKDDPTGLVVGKERVWVNPADYRQRGPETTAGYVIQDRIWDPPAPRVLHGLGPGDIQPSDVDEELSIPLGTDGVTGGCATESWTNWQYIHQSRLIGVGPEETITVPAGTFTTLPIRVDTQETNNPYNGCDETSPVHTIIYWLAPGVGYVQVKNFDVIYQLVERIYLEHVFSDGFEWAGMGEWIYTVP